MCASHEREHHFRSLEVLNVHKSRAKPSFWRLGRRLGRRPGPRPGPTPRPSDQVSDSREMEGLADDRRGIVAVACQCVCSLPIPTGRLGHCRLLPSLRHHCNQLSIELPVDYARDSCSPAASQATTQTEPCTFLQSLLKGPPPHHAGTYHEFSEGEMVDCIATDLCLVSVRSHRLTQLDHRLHDRL